VTAVLDGAIPSLNEGVTAPPPDQVTKALYGDAARPDLGTHQYSNTAEALVGKMNHLVKGAGFVGEGNNTPLTNPADIGRRAFEASIDLRSATREGIYSKRSVVKSMSDDFLGRFGALRTALEAPGLADFVGALATPDVMRSFTAGNLGLGSTYGLTPFNLLAPSRLIYPIYTLYRNKFARPPGQGASLIERLAVGISGSQTGGQAVLDISMPELVTAGNSFGAWPLNLPPAVSEQFVTLNVPYRFFGVTEQLSFLAQWAGQGFEDLSALANLILLQAAMMGEEYQLIAGSSANLATPSAPTCTVRAAQSNETALSTSVVNVQVAAVNYFGRTASSASTAVTVAAGQVVDVVISPVTGAMQYNIYGLSSTPTTYLLATCGGVKYTLQGSLPAAVSANPTADTGTGAGTRMEGVIPTLTGLSAQAGIYPQSPASPITWQGGYVNQNVGQHLNYNVIYVALKALFDSASISPGAFKADPAEIISSGSDIANLSQDVISQGAGTNYEIFVKQGEVGDITVGAAVSQFQNPVTKSILKTIVHPFYLQGNAELLSYQLPQSWTNVANAWEVSCVQDYVSLALPVIDVTYRYILLLMECLVAHAPMYSAHLGGLQQSDVTPYS
jgi:hypothetical protein